MIYWLLFFEFFKIGLFAIGGGMVTIPFLFDLTKKYDWFSAAELTDMIAVSQSTPGPVGVNMATYAGFQTAGISGGIIATFGLVLPSVVIVIWLSKLLSHYAENHAGYCLEYRTDDIKKAFDESVYGLFPITYTSRFDVLMGEYSDYYSSEHVIKELGELFRSVSQKTGEADGLASMIAKVVAPESSPHLKKIVSSCNSKLLQNEELMKHVLKRCCTKATEWKYEKEWRVIMRLPDGAADRDRTLSIMPTCIYLGAKTPETEEKRVLDAVRKDGKTSQWTEGKTVIKEIVVPNKLVNLVVK